MKLSDGSPHQRADQQTSSSREYDVVIASDLRFPGGTSHSIAEEITAQNNAGFTTALAHLNGPLVRKVRGVNPLIRRLIENRDVELLVGRRKVATRLLVLRHPAVVQTALEQLPPMTVENVVVVANAGPVDIDGTRHYDPPTVDKKVRKYLGHNPLWAPIGPLVREAIIDEVPDDRMLPSEWVNIIDVDAWAVERPSWMGPRPVIGRHSRPSAQKWPEDEKVLRAVYPVDGRWDVRILGGAEPAANVLGKVPEAWMVRPFGAIVPQDFLAELDFFVYYHDSRWVEAFGRTVLEAIASGLPAIIPPHFRSLFGSAGLYAEPHEVRSLIEELHADRGRYEAHVQHARAHIRTTFGHEAHQNRLSKLIGPPSGGDAAQSEPAPDQVVDQARPGPALPKQRTVTECPRVLLISSNGAGMGHLTRLLAYARRLADFAEPHFLSMSQAVPVVGQFDFPYEYLPSTQATSMAPGIWQRMFVDRVADCLRRVQPRVVVFDGTWPYNGIPTIRHAFPEARWIWSRRGMWRQGANPEQIAKSQWFDQVIEPGDFSSPYDHGATVPADAVRLGPVTILDRDEMARRDDARRALGLPLDSPLGLISLGAGNINDTSDDIGAATTALMNLGVKVCVTQPEIAASNLERSGVHLVRDYPLARWYSAFDLIVSAAGYNSHQELLRMGVPSLLVPNESTALDDQRSRAQYAADQGWAYTQEKLSVDTTQPLLADLLDRGLDMVRGAQQSDPGNGAQEAADLILKLAADRAGAAAQ